MKRRRQGGARPEAGRARRIVVKVGSSVLTSQGKVHTRAIARIAAQVAELVRDGREVVLVSSGAIAMGAKRLGWQHPGRTIPEKQAAAAVGQIDLIEHWRRCLARRGCSAAQVLLTRSGLDAREQFLNARHTLLELLKRGVVPVVNENDTVATEEIRFGDNDNLSATVLNLVGGELLVILTDVDGLYQKPPGADARPGRDEIFDVIDQVTPELEAASGGSSSTFGRGGMLTKLEAARNAALSGAATVLANGKRADVLLRAAKGESEGTLLRAGRRMRGRKHWLAFTVKARGTLVCDDGAVRAIRVQGRSLLPAGIAEVRGRFGVGDPVALADPQGLEFARGLSGYASEDIERIRGHSTKEIGQLLGYPGGAEVVHRDDLVLLGAQGDEDGGA